MKLMIELTSASWWKAATVRALRTAIAVLIPLLTAQTLLDLDWLLVGSTLGLSVLVSYLTSLAGLKELTSSAVPRFHAITVRTVKQFAQTLVGFIGASVIIQEVDWSTALVLSVTSAVVTALLGVLTILPEEATVLVADDATLNIEE